MDPIEEIKQRLDIVELIGTYVPLQKAGRNYKALCPFHSEKTPSFIIFPETQGWHCFGACSTGGDIFSFIMRRENMDFAEALRFLADKAGVELHPLGVEALQQRDELDRMRALNTSAAQYYHHILLETPQGESARRYLERRGVTRETILAFQLGYALEEWHALEEALKRAHFEPQDILAAGLTNKSESGNIYDRFRGRLIFPIRDAQGQVLGFGGRVLDDSLPKYLNTPDTPLFDKGNVLYGIDLARESIRQVGVVVIVEGYMDVIIPHQCGVTNLVACMGTALTEAHLRTLKRLTKRFVLAMDPDAAGMHAVEKGVETAHQHLDHKVVPVPTATGLIRYEEQLDAEIRVLTLPEGLDPDELILRDRARWDHLLAAALPVVEYFMQVVLGPVGAPPLAEAKAKKEAAERLLPIIAALNNPVERTHYVQHLARRLHVDERELVPLLEHWRAEAGASAARSRRPQAAVQAQPGPGAAADSQWAAEMAMSLESRCLALLMQMPALWAEVHALAGLSGEDVQDARNRQVYEALAAFVGAQPQGELADFRATLDSSTSTHVELLLQGLRSGPPLSPETMHEDLIKSSTRLRKQHLQGLIRNLRFLQQDAQEEDGSGERMLDLVRMIEQLTRQCQEMDRRAYAATLAGRKQVRDSGKGNGAHDAH